MIALFLPVLLNAILHFHENKVPFIISKASKKKVLLLTLSERKIKAVAGFNIEPLKLVTDEQINGLYSS